MNINPSGKNFAACIIHPDLTQSRRKTVIGGGGVFAGVNNLAVRDCEAQLEEAIGSTKRPEIGTRRLSHVRGAISRLQLRFAVGANVDCKDITKHGQISPGGA